MIAKRSLRSAAAVRPTTRVTLFVNSVEMGGVEEHVRQIAVGLHARDFDVSLICPESEDISPLAEAVRAAGVAVYRLSLSSEMGIPKVISRFVQLVRHLRRVEVLHIHLTGYLGGRWAVLAGKLAGVKTIVCTLQIAPDAPQSWRVRVERRLVNLAVDRFVSVSQVTCLRQVTYLGQSQVKTVVIPNAVELDRYRDVSPTARGSIRNQHHIPANAPVIGSVARLNPQKGLNYLIDAMPEILIAVPDAHLLLVGDGQLRKELEQRARERNVQKQVHFAGHQKDIPSWLAAMDIFVLPSVFEGLPLSILEAMAAGLPVVATEVDGTPEAVEDGVTGRLVPAQDSMALVNSCVELLTHPEIMLRMGAAGRKRAELFSDTALLDRLAKLYREASAK